MIFLASLVLVMAIGFGPSVLRTWARRQPDPALARYRFAVIVKYATFDERIYLRGEARDLGQKIAALALRRRRIAASLKKLDKAAAAKDAKPVPAPIPFTRKHA